MIGNRRKPEDHQGKARNPRGRFELPGLPRPNAYNPSQEFVCVVDIVPNAGSDLGLSQAGFFDEVSDIYSHAPKFASMIQNAQGGVPCKSAPHRQNGPMSGWAYQEAFDKRYREFIARTKKRAPEVAAMFGVSVHTLNSWRRGNDATKPPDRLLAMAAILFGCDVYEFMPDWGLLVGLKIDLSEMTEEDIHKVCRDLRPVSGGPMTQAEREFYIDALKRLNAVKKVTTDQ